jgi:hypothetical protein
MLGFTRWFGFCDNESLPACPYNYKIYRKIPRGCSVYQLLLWLRMALASGPLDRLDNYCY